MPTGRGGAAVIEARGHVSKHARPPARLDGQSVPLLRRREACVERIRVGVRVRVRARVRVRVRVGVPLLGRREAYVKNTPDGKQMPLYSRPARAGRLIGRGWPELGAAWGVLWR